MLRSPFPYTIKRRVFKVGESDMAVVLDVENYTRISVDDSSYIRRHQSSSITDGNTTLPNESLRTDGTNININSARPTVVGVYGVDGNGESMELEQFRAR